MWRQGSILDWLKRLEEADLCQVSPRLAEECARLVALRGAWRSREDLADALASRLASDERTWSAIRDHFLKDANGEPRDTTDRAASGPSVPTSCPGAGKALPLAPGLPTWMLRRHLSGLAWGCLLAVVIVFAVVLGPALLGVIVAPIIPPEWATSPEVIAQVEESHRNAEKRVELHSAPLETSRPPLTERARVTLETGPSRTELETMAPLSPGPTPTLPGPDWLRWLLLLGSPLLALLAARWWIASTQLRVDIDAIDAEAERQRADKQAEGRAFGAPYHVVRHLWLDRGKVDDAATILGRVRDGRPGDDLDVLPTLARTIAAGGRLIPVFAAGSRRQVPLVLVDIEQAGHPYLDTVELLLARWQDGGLVFDRHDFDWDPDHLRTWPERHPVSLDELARRAEGRPLLIFSRMALPQGYYGGSSWLRLLPSWPARAWIDLDPRTLAEHGAAGAQLRERLAIARLHRYPLTADGLVRAARSLAVGEPLAPEPELPLASVDELSEALWKWAACAALVPDPTWPQLEAVRRELPELRTALPDPRLVQRLIEWARHEGLGIHGRHYLLGTGPRLAFDPDRRSQLIARLREHDARLTSRTEDRLEWRARELLIRQLAAAHVENDPFGEALRQAKIAFHRAVMHPEQAAEALREHTCGAAARELKRLTVEELSLQPGGSHLAGRWDPEDTAELAVWSTGAAWARLDDLLRWRAWSPWVLARVLPWAAVAVASTVLWWGEVAGRWDIVPGFGDPPSAQAVEVRVVTMPAMWKVQRLESQDGVASPPVEDELVALADVVPMRFVALPAGEFMMGSPQSEEGRYGDEGQYRARVSAFAIATHEVTLAQWQAVMTTRPNDCEYGCDDNHPVSSVSWNDACRFTMALTERENERRRTRGLAVLTPCYVADGDTCVWPAANRACTGYRLPTEAEWEYAARAGTTSAYFFGENPNDLCNFGNVDDLPGSNKNPTSSVSCDDKYRRLAPVGSFKANPWGLYDVHGNVREWVWDLFQESPLEAGEDPVPTLGSQRVLRGGSYMVGPWRQRVAYRDWGMPLSGYRDFGFRCFRNGLSET